MNRSLALKTHVITVLVIVANVLGNFFMSLGLKRRGEVLGPSALEYIRVLFDPLVGLGVVLLIVWLLSRMALLSWADLSYVVPVTSLGYGLNAVMGAALLGERMHWTRWSGTLLIVAGTALVGSTSIRTTPPKARAAVAQESVR